MIYGETYDRDNNDNDKYDDNVMLHEYDQWSYPWSITLSYKSLKYIPSQDVCEVFIHFEKPCLFLPYPPDYFMEGF